MGARMGVVTGKGFGGLIRERFGARWAALAILVMLVANLFTTVAEFAGIATSLKIFGVPTVISVPVAAVAVYLLMVKFNFRRVQQVFLLSSVLYLSYVVSGLRAGPDWHQALASTLHPSIPFTNTSYLLMLVATVGTTITPWGQFFIQSYIVDKRLGVEDLGYARADVYLGAFFTNFIAFFIIIACAATIWASKTFVDPATADAGQLAVALRPLAGRFASGLFAFGLLNASLLGAAILPLTTAYATSETFGWEAGIDKRFREAPIFYGILAGFIFIAGLIVLVPNLPLLLLMFLPQVLNGALLPVVLIFVLKITNDRLVMGKYTNSPMFNVVAVVTAAVMILLTAALLASPWIG
jgi:Mn2+/Fe2+ NRAMP family transporter